MSKFNVSRRTFVNGGLGLTVANFMPGTTPFASAATMEESTIAAAKTVGQAAVNGMISLPASSIARAAETGRWSGTAGNFLTSK